MASTTLLTSAGPFLRARGVNANDASFPSRIPTIAEPSSAIATAAGTQQAINIADGNFGVGQNSALIVPYGLGANNDGFSIRMIGWRSINRDGATRLWVPVILAEVACLMSAAVGIAGAAVINTEAFCDTLTLVTGNANISVETVSPTGDVIGHIIVALKGFQKLELTFDQTTNTPTTNALVSLF